MADESRDAKTVIVDAMNVIGSRPNGWWRDRDGALRRLVRALQRLAVEDDVALVVVADGRPLPDLPEGPHGGVHVFYASRPGSNAADDRIIELIEASPNAALFEVVTSDRELARRARELGAAIGSPTRLLERLERIGR